MGKHSAPSSSTSSSTRPSTGAKPRHAAPGQDKRDTAQIRHATRVAHDVAPARSGSGGKPSTTGHAAGGAVKGAAVGATLGSVVPGVGTAVGAGAGAVLGGAGGAVSGSRRKGEWRRAQRTSGQRLLVAEFVVCALILALSPLTDKHKTDTPARWIQRATGVCGLFVVLGLIGSAGPRTAKVAAGLGGLVTVTLAVSDRDLFVTIAGRLGAPPPAGPAGPGTKIDDRIDVPTQFGTQPGIPNGGAPPALPGAATPALPGTPARPGRNSRIRPI